MVGVKQAEDRARLGNAPVSIESVSAITLATHDMARSVRFYRALGFDLHYGGEEAEWPGEQRILVPSPRDVPSYDLEPEMSAPEVTDKLVAALREEEYRFVVVNYANPDMVGHTGSIPAVIRAGETVDACLARLLQATERAGGICLVTADHGNAEQMLASDGVSPHTAHTTNPVPVVLTVAAASLRSDGELRDLAPTVLALLDLPVPPEMTGRSLLQTGNVKSS